MELEALLFYANAVFAVATAAVVILHRNPVVEVLALVLHLLSIAVFFVLLSAPFAAVIQVILYAGAIMVLFLFVVMLLDPSGEGFKGRVGKMQLGATLLGAGAMLFAILPVLMAAGGDGSATLPEGFGGVTTFGELMFSEYMFPFEAVSILLLSAMVGALYLAKREIN
jgi:NADH-quinone oxidoreductase subunit J